MRFRQGYRKGMVIRMRNRIKNLKKIQYIRWIVALAFLLLFWAAGGGKGSAAEEGNRVCILFTHDMHSHINSFQTVYEGSSVNIGGFARIQTIIEEKRGQSPELLLVDGGDFSMGSLFQTVYETQASELRLMGAMGYDATTFGNHEFDFRSKGLENMLRTAAGSGDGLPSLLVCNVDWSQAGEEQLGIKAAFQEYGVKDYIIVEKNGIKIALLGVFGQDALACAPTCALSFKNPADAVAETVAEIRRNEDVDMLVCLSHCGTNEDRKKSEDEIIAQKVPELDVIISGHSHTTLEEPLVYGNTYIVSAGEYGKAVGAFTMAQKEGGRWSMEDYELIPTTEDVPEDDGMKARIAEFEKTIDEDYLSLFSYTSDQVLAHNSYAFSTVQALEQQHTEHNLGNLMADAYIYAVETAKGYDGIPVDMAVVPSGTVRDTYVPGDITVEDVFNSFSLGIGKDGIPGYPLVSVYLTGKELKIAAEIDASISDFMKTARLYMSGLNMTYNPHRLILNKVTDVYMTRGDNGHMLPGGAAGGIERIELEDDKLYRVVADLYSGQMLSEVTDKSYGLLSLVPKYADGTPVTDFEDCIVYDGDKELKAWAGIAKYIASFETNADGIPEIPEYYKENRGRKNVEDKKDLISLIKSPNKYAAMIVVAILLAIIILTVVIIAIARLVRSIFFPKRLRQ